MLLRATLNHGHATAMALDSRCYANCKCKVTMEQSLVRSHARKSDYPRWTRNEL